MNDVLPVRSHRTVQIIAVAAMMLAVAFLPGAADAAKPSSMTLNVADGAYGQVTTAWVGSGAVSTAAASESTGLKVKAECFQNGVIVYRQYANVSGGAAALTLGPTPSWTAGAASCVAELGSFDKRTRWRVQASDTFSATG